jgi:hypothetical protein
MGIRKHSGKPQRPSRRFVTSPTHSVDEYFET